MSNEIQCPHCATSAPHGVSICTGCQANVTYERYTFGTALVQWFVGSIVLYIIALIAGGTGNDNSYTLLLLLPYYAFYHWWKNRKSPSKVFFQR